MTMLRQKLVQAGGDSGEPKATGAGLYLALARLEGLMSGRVENFNEPMAAVSCPAVPAAVAFVCDFTVEHRAELSSEVFTAVAVGGMVVGLAKSEGVILDDDARGLAVRLNQTISPTLAAMLGSFRRCLDVAAMIMACGGLPGSLALAE